MIILIFIIIILVALIVIALYLHFSKKPEPAYDPERVKLERENEERIAKARMEADRQATRNFFK